MGGALIIGKRTQRETRMHFSTVKEASGWSATPWGNQLLSNLSVISWDCQQSAFGPGSANGWQSNLGAVRSTGQLTG